MIERVALAQTSLRMPGLRRGMDGVVLGERGLVLLPTMGALVRWLAAMSRDGSTEDMLPSLEIRVVRSEGGRHEAIASFAADSVSRMDRAADAARVVGGFTFTGAMRRFVQHRDAAAPFGYDAVDAIGADDLVHLDHGLFRRSVDLGPVVPVATLVGRLQLHRSGSADGGPASRLVAAEGGLGPALIHYLGRANVDGEVAVVEWPAGDLARPVRRYLFRLDEVPRRMLGLFAATPGLTSFVPAGPGVAVECGYRHPLHPQACPVFDARGLVLLRGRGQPPWTIERLPTFAKLEALTLVTFRSPDGEPEAQLVRAASADAVQVRVRLVAVEGRVRPVTAVWISEDNLPLLRRLAYSIDARALQGARVAVTDRGAFLVCPGGVAAVPIGAFFVEIYPGVYVPAGFELVPAVAPAVLCRTLALPAGHRCFFEPAGALMVVPDEAFGPLEAALLESSPWDLVTGGEVEAALEERPVELELEPVGLRALAGVEMVSDATDPRGGGEGR